MLHIICDLSFTVACLLTSLQLFYLLSCKLPLTALPQLFSLFPFKWRLMQIHKKYICYIIFCSRTSNLKKKKNSSMSDSYKLGIFAGISTRTIKDRITKTMAGLPNTIPQLVASPSSFHHNSHRVVIEESASNYSMTLTFPAVCFAIYGGEQISVSFNSLKGSWSFDSCFEVNLLPLTCLCQSSV